MGLIGASFCLDVHELRYPQRIRDKLTWLGLVPLRGSASDQGGERPPDDGLPFPLRPLSSLIGDRVSKGFSNAELVYLQELRNMGKIEDISPEGKYVVQDIYFVRGWRSILRSLSKG